MKKALKISTTTIFIILMGLTYSSCKKESKEVKIIAKENQSPPPIPNTGGGGQVINYCEGCGFATISDFACKYYGSNPGCHSIYDDCAQTTMVQYMAANDDGSLSPLNTEFAYFVRDSFMVNFDKGVEYIKYYNMIGEVMNYYDVLNPSNFMQHYNFVKEVETTMDNLINGPDDYIPVTATFKEHAIDMIDYYRTVDNSVVFNDVLDIIQEDVTNLEGKTRAEIYALY